MLQATGGVNTHKGAIFLLGTVCGAIGRLWRAEAPCRDIEQILQSCIALSKHAIEQDFARMQQQAPETFGERLYRETGLTGARGQLLRGMPAVSETALPLLEQLLQTGQRENDACALTLLALIGRGEDTNLIKRGGRETAAWAAARASALLENGRIPNMEEIRSLDRAFIERNLSPGGCADLLAVTIFLHLWSKAE